MKKITHHFKKHWLLASLLVFVLTSLHSQEISRLGLGIESFSSGNTHGTFIRPYTGFEWGKHFVSVGPLIHKRSSMVKGLRAEYSRNLSGQGDKYWRAADGKYHFDLLQINLLAHIQYNGALRMSYNAILEQQRICRVKDINWDQVTLSTAEMGLGCEVRLNITRHITWRNSFSAALHYHTDQVNKLPLPRAGQSLALATGLLFVIE